MTTEPTKADLHMSGTGPLPQSCRMGPREWVESIEAEDSGSSALP
jgi:hypothetical protein